jgi:hypothetical protein
MKNMYNFRCFNVHGVINRHSISASNYKIGAIFVIKRRMNCVSTPGNIRFVYGLATRNLKFNTTAINT